MKYQSTILVLLLLASLVTTGCDDLIGIGFGVEVRKSCINATINGEEYAISQITYRNERLPVGYRPTENGFSFQVQQIINSTSRDDVIWLSLRLRADEPMELNKPYPLDTSYYNRGWLGRDEPLVSTDGYVMFTKSGKPGGNTTRLWGQFEFSVVDEDGNTIVNVTDGSFENLYGYKAGPVE